MKLHIHQNMLMAFHPQTNGLSEQKNKWVEQYLQLLTSNHPEHWMEWLPLAMAIYNNQRNATTSLMPNQILLGYETTLISDSIPDSNNEMAEEQVTLLQEYWNKVIEALNKMAQSENTPQIQYQ
jgi:hypothetical protein